MLHSLSFFQTWGLYLWRDCSDSRRAHWAPRQPRHATNLWFIWWFVFWTIPVGFCNYKGPSKILNNMFIFKWKRGLEVQVPLNTVSWNCLIVPHHGCQWEFSFLRYFRCIAANNIEWGQSGSLKLQMYQSSSSQSSSEHLETFLPSRPFVPSSVRVLSSSLSRLPLQFWLRPHWSASVCFLFVSLCRGPSGSVEMMIGFWSCFLQRASQIGFKVKGFYFGYGKIKHQKPVIMQILVVFPSKHPSLDLIHNHDKIFAWLVQGGIWTCMVAAPSVRSSIEVHFQPWHSGDTVVT